MVAALKGLKRDMQRRARAPGANARAFLETRAGNYRLLYRLDREALKVALLAHVRRAHVGVQIDPAPPAGRRGLEPDG